MSNIYFHAVGLRKMHHQLRLSFCYTFESSKNEGTIGIERQHDVNNIIALLTGPH